jgi:hypothetical protein
LSRAGVHAKLIIGGGPHIKMSVSSLGGGKCLAIISSFTKPMSYDQSTEFIQQKINFHKAKKL